MHYIPVYHVLSYLHKTCLGREASWVLSRNEACIAQRCWCHRVETQADGVTMTGNKGSQRCYRQVGAYIGGQRKEHYKHKEQHLKRQKGFDKQAFCREWPIVWNGWSIGWGRETKVLKSEWRCGASMRSLFLFVRKVEIYPLLSREPLRYLKWLMSYCFIKKKKTTWQQSKE